jgi:hypothetical protein
LATENSSNNREGAKSLSPHRFQPGQSGNPGGRPKKQPVTDHLRSQLEQRISEAMKAKLPAFFVEMYGAEATFGQLLAFKMVMKAAKGDVRALREVLDRVEGKVAYKEAGREGQSPIEIRVLRCDL